MEPFPKVTTKHYYCYYCTQKSIEGAKKTLFGWKANEDFDILSNLEYPKPVQYSLVYDYTQHSLPFGLDRAENEFPNYLNLITMVFVE